MSEHHQASSEVRLSYKFQRLREQLRAAISSGELSGKLPGERELARRFNVNAKTLGKALTDLAAEGLLDRAVGRGTYVKGAAPETSNGRVLVLVDENLVATSSPAAWIETLRANHPTLALHAGAVDQLRPSFLNQFTAVIDFAHHTPDAFIRELIVRNIPVVAAGYEPHGTSVNSVVIDRVLGMTKMTRRAVLDGHRRIGVVAGPRSDDLIKAARQAAAFETTATIDVYSPSEARAAVDSGVTALIADCVECGRAVLRALGNASTIDVFVVGAAVPQLPCPGIYVTPQQVTSAILERLAAPPAARPAVIYLAGQFMENDADVASKTAPDSFTQPKYFPRFY